MKEIITNEEMALTWAFRRAGINAEVNIENAYCGDCKFHRAIVIRADIDCGDAPFEILFDPYTGEHTDSYLTCPIVE